MQQPTEARMEFLDHESPSPAIMRLKFRLTGPIPSQRFFRLEISE